MIIQHKGYLYALAAALLWSGFILVSRMGGISELLAYDVIAIRYVTCATLLLPIWWFKYRFNLLDFKLFFASLVGGLAYALCTFKGFELTPASHAAILLPGLIPLLIILLAVLINKERQTIGKWLAMALTAMGIFLLFSQQLATEGGLSQGHLFLAAGAFCWALFSILVARWNISPWQATVSLAVITCILYMPVYIFLLPKNLSVNVWPDILLQAFYQGFLATIVQMIFYVRAVQILGASSMGSMMAVVPVLSGIAALFIFNESASIELVVGLMLVSLGAWLAHTKLIQKVTVLNFKLIFNQSNP
jgi:drug/metabolite transporter (DMT)-like permease